MSRISIIDIDSKIPNLALEKIALYHHQQGDEVVWDMPLVQADKIYVSCVFDWNKYKCAQWEGVAEIGGSGYSLEKTLPPEIDTVRPKINLGFTTRGCIRNCPFCIVRQKEGQIRAVADIYDLWDGKAKDVVLLDNNILALPEHFKLICNQLRKEKLRVDFNQGLDCRLFTEEIAQELKTISKVDTRFAFDSLEVYPAVVRAVKLIKKYKISQPRWYVYADENYESALERLLILKRLGQRTYLMRDKRVYDIPKFIILAQWGCHPPQLAKKDIHDLIVERTTGKPVKNQKELFEGVDQPIES